MSTNPYEPPESAATSRVPEHGERDVAKRSLRIALVLMLPSAVYNFICYNFPTDPEHIEIPIYSVYRVFNGLGFIAITTAIWWFGLLILEFLTGGFHAFFGRHSELGAWKTALYRMLHRLPPFAIVGAVLWAIWIAGFYQLDIGFYAVSVPVGIAGHLLAAGWYVPLFYRWYRIERSASPRTMA
jgi:hypothetical protein